MDTNLMQVPAKKSKKKPALLICIILAAAALAALVIYAYNASGNSYKTPIAIAAEQANDRSYKNDLDLHYNALNGFAQEEAAVVFALVTATAGYQQSLEEERWFFDEKVGFNKKAYGEDWQLKFKVSAAEKMESAALERYAGTLQTKAQAVEKTVTGNTELDRSLLAYAAQLKAANVTDGYELTVKKVMTGSILTEPAVEETCFSVYKVNGRWVIGETPIGFLAEAVRYATKG